MTIKTTIHDYINFNHYDIILQDEDFSNIEKEIKENFNFFKNIFLNHNDILNSDILIIKTIFYEYFLYLARKEKFEINNMALLILKLLILCLKKQFNNIDCFKIFIINKNNISIDISLTDTYCKK